MGGRFDGGQRWGQGHAGGRSCSMPRLGATPPHSSVRLQPCCRQSSFHLPFTHSCSASCRRTMSMMHWLHVLRARKNVSVTPCMPCSVASLSAPYLQFMRQASEVACIASHVSSGQAECDTACLSCPHSKGWFAGQHDYTPGVPASAAAQSLGPGRQSIDARGQRLQ